MEICEGDRVVHTTGQFAIVILLWKKNEFTGVALLQWEGSIGDPVWSLLRDIKLEVK